jgi:MinD superfamily P-loop ATPase
LLSLGLAFVSCKENATSKIEDTNLETAKERDAKISLGSAIIEFDTKDYDFGTVKEGDVVEGVFKVANKGKTDLVITDASASCGCTVPEWSKNPLNLEILPK